jgi:hypothetical protein
VPAGALADAAYQLCVLLEVGALLASEPRLINGVAPSSGGGEPLHLRADAVVGVVELGLNRVDGDLGASPDPLSGFGPLPRTFEVGEPRCPGGGVAGHGGLPQLGEP